MLCTYTRKTGKPAITVYKPAHVWVYFFCNSLHLDHC